MTDIEMAQGTVVNVQGIPTSNHPGAVVMGNPTGPNRNNYTPPPERPSAHGYYWIWWLHVVNTIAMVAWIPIGLYEWTKLVDRAFSWRGDQEFRVMFIWIFGGIALLCLLPTVFGHLSKCFEKDCIYNRLGIFRKIRFKWALVLIAIADIFHVMIFFQGLLPLIIFDAVDNATIDQVETLTWIWAGFWLIHQILLEVVFWSFIYYNSKVWRFDDENNACEVDEFSETCCGCNCGGNSGCCGCFGNQ